MWLWSILNSVALLIISYNRRLSDCPNSYTHLIATTHILGEALAFDSRIPQLYSPSNWLRASGWLLTTRRWYSLFTTKVSKQAYPRIKAFTFFFKNYGLDWILKSTLFFIKKLIASLSTTTGPGIPIRITDLAHTSTFSLSADSTSTRT